MSEIESDRAPKSVFPQTAWSRIHAGGGGAGPEEIKEALEDICRRYWGPARRYLSSLGCDREDAEDLAQDFFSKWAQPEKLVQLGPEKGRLRSYLKQALRNHVINHWRSKSNQRRGGDQVILSLDEGRDEMPEEAALAEAEYDTAWAEAVVAAVLGRLGTAYGSRGRDQIFNLLADGLPGGKGLKPYAEICVLTGMKSPQVKIEMHRLRRRFAEALRTEVAGTLASEDDLEDELRHLMRVMAHAHGDPT